MNPVESEEGGAFGGSLSSTAVPSVPTWQILLTPADDLERTPVLRTCNHQFADTNASECKGRFARISSVHVYSLSPETVKVRVYAGLAKIIVANNSSIESHPSRYHCNNSPTKGFRRLQSTHARQGSRHDFEPTLELAGDSSNPKGQNGQIHATAPCCSHACGQTTSWPLGKACRQTLGCAKWQRHSAAEETRACV